jgi:uncharacterized protein YecA (UPF0149 family)
MSIMDLLAKMPSAEEMQQTGEKVRQFADKVDARLSAIEDALEKLHRIEAMIFELHDAILGDRGESDNDG